MKIDIEDIQIVRPELLKKGDVLIFRIVDRISDYDADRFRAALYDAGIPGSTSIVFATGVDGMRIVTRDQP